MPAADFFWFLAASIDLLRKDSDESYLRLSAALKGLRAKISANGHTRHVYFNDNRFVIDHPSSAHDIEVVFDDRSVLDLIDGKCSLEHSLLSGAVHIKGDIRTIETYHSSLGIYLNGALRSSGFPVLLSQYRLAVSSGG